MGNNKRGRPVDGPDGDTLSLIDRALAALEPEGKRPGEFTVADLYLAGNRSTDETTLRSRANKMVREGKWLRRQVGKSVFYKFAD
jgi:hypothetical protein